jgi:curved DNA-binding protein CbpA
MDDYYTLIGVEPDAPVDDIRAAYRDKKAAIVGTTDTDKLNAKKLNKAWNVLSDPYQRGRYDEERAKAVDSGELDESDDADDTPSTNGRRPTRQTRERGQPRPPLQPTLELPRGMTFAPRRQRLVAMGIDLVVLLVLFLGITQFGAQALAKSQKPQVVENVKTYNNQIDDLTKARDDAKKAAKGDTTKCGAADVTPVKQKECDADKALKDKTKQRDDEVAKLNSIFFGSIALTFLLGFLYLAIPSMKNGQTLGKRLQHIKVVREDGAPLRAGDVVRRYGIIIIVSFGLFLFLRELAAVLVLVGVTRWMANANHQGLHDRLAKTIVIEDGGAA